MSEALPVAIAVGGAVYVLSTQPATTPVLPPQQVPGGSTNYPPYDPMGLTSQAQPGDSAKVDALMAAASAKFDQMSDQAKQDAASYINSTYNPQPPLTGKETWQQTASVIGGAIGGAYAGPLGAIAGAYLGTTLEGWLASDLPAIEQWVKDNLGSEVNNVINDITQYLGI